MARDFGDIQKIQVIEIIELHNSIMDAVQINLEKAVRIGELLTQQRELLKHGEWLPWVEANLPFSDRSTRRYLQLYENRGQVLQAGGIVKALEMLSEPKSATVSDIQSAPVAEFSDSIMRLGVILEDMKEGETVSGITHEGKTNWVNMKMLADENVHYELVYMGEESAHVVSQVLPVVTLLLYLAKHPHTQGHISWIYPGMRIYNDLIESRGITN